MKKKALRPALQTYPLKIKNKITEAKDSVSFVLETTNKEHKPLFYHTPAQFLTFEFQIGGKTYLRSYSLSSCPLLNEDMKTTVKKVKGGVVSNYMTDHLKKGDIIWSRKPAGRFFKAPPDLKPKHYVLFAGGSGITPLFSIIKTVLLSDPKNKVDLLYANRDEQSIIYHKELKDLKAGNKNRFTIRHILSQPKQTWCDISGRLNKEHLQKHFTQISHPPDHLYYLCGPLDFMQMIESFLIQNKARSAQIRKESFLSATQKKQISARRETSSYTGVTKAPENQSSNELANQEALNIKPEEKQQLKKDGKNLSDNPEKSLVLTGQQGESQKEEPELIRAFINEQSVEVSAQPDIPILEQLLSAGHAPPFSCLSGSCMSCVAVLKKGRIFQEEKGILEEENIKNHEFLSCQAKPISRIVEVDYDSDL